MKLQTKIIIGLVAFIFVLFIALGVSVKLYQKEHAEKIRHEQNESELTKNLDQVNMILNLSRADFAKMNTWWSNKVDSVAKANKIAPKSIQSATIINTKYKDTVKTEASHKEPEIAKKEEVESLKIQPSKSAVVYRIPVEENNGCWGMKGNIITTDRNAKLNITERMANNSSQLLILRERFLGFLWYKNKTAEGKSFSDCGTSTFNVIKFSKK